MSEETADGKGVPITVVIYVVAVVAAIAMAVMGQKTDEGITVLGGVPFAFVLFVLVLMGVACFVVALKIFRWQ